MPTQDVEGVISGPVNNLSLFKVYILILTGILITRLFFPQFHNITPNHSWYFLFKRILIYLCPFQPDVRLFTSKLSDVQQWSWVEKRLCKRKFDFCRRICLKRVRDFVFSMKINGCYIRKYKGNFVQKKYFFVIIDLLQLLTILLLIDVIDVI